ncbi:MAG TPA: heavy metal-responsive transcriptional regulator [Rhodospirillales bacterium]|nr:heavy metal-responsive transcriptional regulator [Rhodospirillales bacterium]
MRRSEIAARADCHPETVRFYERQGLLPPPPRNGAGHRIYGPAHLRRLRFVVRCRALGFSLEEIRALLDLVDRGGWTCAEVRERTARHLRTVRRKIEDLARMQATLEELIGRCSGAETPDCAVLEALFEPPAGDPAT